MLKSLLFLLIVSILKMLCSSELTMCEKKQYGKHNYDNRESRDSSKNECSDFCYRPRNRDKNRYSRDDSYCGEEEEETAGPGTD